MMTMRKKKKKNVVNNLNIFWKEENKGELMILF